MASPDDLDPARAISALLDLCAEGGTEYLPESHMGSPRTRAERRPTLSFATNAASGFSDDDVALLAGASRARLAICKFSLRGHCTRSLATYLGRPTSMPYSKGTSGEAKARPSRRDLLADFRAFTALRTAMIPCGLSVGSTSTSTSLASR